MNLYTATYQFQISDLFLLGAMGELDLKQSVFVFMRTIILSFPAAQKRLFSQKSFVRNTEKNTNL